MMSFLLRGYGVQSAGVLCARAHTIAHYRCAKVCKSHLRLCPLLIMDDGDMKAVRARAQPQVQVSCRIMRALARSPCSFVRNGGFSDRALTLLCAERYLHSYTVRRGRGGSTATHVRRVSRLPCPSMILRPRVYVAY